MRSLSVVCSITPLLLIAQPVLAAAEAGAPDDATQSDGANDAGGTSGSDIVVLASRLRGQIDAAQPPLVTLDADEIASYGAGTISDLIEAISPQTGSGRGRGEGRPVFLVNGQRISSFREMQAIPPEAIRRLEVLPEEVALRFGYPPNQRVVNFILKDKYSSRTIDAEYRGPTRGGFAETELEGSMLRVDGPSRLNLTAKIEDSSMLTEAERGVRQEPGSVPTVAGDPDPARFRSLIDDSRAMSLNGTWSRGLGADGRGGQVSLNAKVTRSDSRSLFGLDTVLLSSGGASELRSLPGALVRTSKATIGEAGVTLNKPLGDWQLTATVDGSYSDTEALTDREADTAPLAAAAAAGTLALNGALPALADAGFDRARTRDSAVSSLVTMAGRPLQLPAGEAALTLKAGFDWDRTDNRDTRSGERTRLDRGDVSAGLNLALPLTSRKERVLAGAGDLTLNLSAGLNRLSDFGTLTNWSAGLAWQLTDRLNLQASHIVNEAAPGLNQLGNPVQLAFNVPVYDFSRGETALVTIINGGNPDLVRETQRDLKLSLKWDLPIKQRTDLVVDWFRNRSSDVTQGFPLLTPAIEAAFPGRAIRDAAGRLTAIDRRPVTFSEVSSSRIRWGINTSGRIGKEPVRGPAGRAQGPGGVEGRGTPQPTTPGFRSGGPGRWNLSVYHTLRFSERATIAPGGPVLDLLDRDAIRTGGVPRHEIELEGGFFYKGFGLRTRGNWIAPTHVSGGGVPGASDLRFGSVLKLQMRAFVNFDMQPGVVRAIPFLKGARLALVAENVFDSRQKVTDRAGEVPIGLQRDYRDPRGRVVELDFRKMF